jgi:hypothetical protein
MIMKTWFWKTKKEMTLSEHTINSHTLSGNENRADKCVHKWQTDRQTLVRLNAPPSLW